MEKSDSNIFDATTKLISNKKQPNESTTMTSSSEKPEELNIDKELTERLKRLVEYRKLENKPHNRVNSYCNISDDNQRTEHPLYLIP